MNMHPRIQSPMLSRALRAEYNDVDDTLYTCPKNFPTWMLWSGIMALTLVGFIVVATVMALLIQAVGEQSPAGVVTRQSSKTYTRAHTRAHTLALIRNLPHDVARAHCMSNGFMWNTLCTLLHGMEHLWLR